MPCGGSPPSADQERPAVDREIRNHNALDSTFVGSYRSTFDTTLERRQRERSAQGHSRKFQISVRVSAVVLPSAWALRL